MQLLQPFDATKVDPTQGMRSLPIGKHPVVITASEVKGTTAGDSGLLALTLDIIDGPAKGQQGIYRLNIYNQSEKAREIAQRQLSALCHVIGVFQVQDSQALHGRPFVIEVALQRDADSAAKGYTEIVKVYDINGNEPGKAPPIAQPAQQQQAAPPAAGWGAPPPVAAAPPAMPAAPGPAWGAATAAQPAAAPPAGGWAPAGGGAPPWASNA